jgi:N-acetylneuraminic acid mutarotase
MNAVDPDELGGSSATIPRRPGSPHPQGTTRVPQAGRSTLVPYLSGMRAVGVLLCVLVCAGAAAGAGGWRSGAPLPAPRSEVAAAATVRSIAVVGGFAADGSTSSRVDAYDPANDGWVRLTDLPVEANHAMAAGFGGRIYVAGGYAGDGHRRRDAFVYANGQWQRLPSMPLERAAGGAAVIDGKLYVAGGTTGLPGVGDARRLARAMLVYDPGKRRWSQLPGPTPREHLGVAALGGKLYVAGGREAGYDTNLGLFEVFNPATRRWRRLAPLPTARGGTGLGAVAGRLVSAGGEEPAGSIASVYRYTPSTNRWSRLPDLPTPRHGVAVVGFGGRVYVIGGGPTPGLSTSGANESIAG